MAANRGRPPVRPPVCLLTRPRIPFRLRQSGRMRAAHYCYHYYPHRHSIVIRPLTFRGNGGTFTQARTARRQRCFEVAACVLIEEPRRWVAEVGGNSRRGVSPEFISLGDRDREVKRGLRWGDERKARAVPRGTESDRETGWKSYVPKNTLWFCDVRR